ncbi:MAG: P-loop NTPase [Spirochaetota bacterium]
MSTTREAVQAELSKIIDPDLGTDIVSLGFVKNIDIEGDTVALEIELTTPACPVRDQFRSQAESLVSALEGVNRVQVSLTSRTPERVKRATDMERTGLDRVNSLVGIASGKGGVGKSTIASAIAMELAREGYRVGLLDMDIYGPSIPTLFEHHDVGLRGDEDNMVVPEEFNGLKVMSFGFWLGTMPAIMRGPMVTNYVQQFLHQVNWGELDYLFIDFPPGTGDVQITITQSVRLDGAVIVTTPHVLSAADVGRAIQMFDKVSVPVLGVVENMSYFVAPDTQARYHVFGRGAAERISTHYGLPILGELPISPQEFGGPATRSPRSEAIASATESMIRELGKARAGRSTPEIDYDDDSVTLRWPDGTTHTVANRKLRASCQCALCVDEFTGEQKLDPDALPEGIRANDVATVGNYAISIEWNDGHTTGFFPYSRIRELAET